MLMGYVFSSSLGVLIRAGQEPYREPLWRNVACSKVMSPSFSFPPVPLPLSIITSLLTHICLHLWLLLHIFKLLQLSALKGVKRSSYTERLCCRPSFITLVIHIKHLMSLHFIGEEASQLLPCWILVRISHNLIWNGVRVRDHFVI